MTAHEAADPEEEGRRTEGSPPPQEEGTPERTEQEPAALDEEAAWAEIVAGYGEEPPDPPGVAPYRPVQDLALPDELFPDKGVAAKGAAGKAGPAGDEDSSEEPPKPLGSSVVLPPGLGAGTGKPARQGASDKGRRGDRDEEDEEYTFVPPDPGPLPTGDTTARFAWLGFLGSPVLLLGWILLGRPMTWWLSTLCLVGFVGGSITLVTRMRSEEDDEDWDDPGNGAVV